MSIHDVNYITFFYSIIPKTDLFNDLKNKKKPPLQKKVAQDFLKKANN